MPREVDPALGAAPADPSARRPFGAATAAASPAAFGATEIVAMGVVGAGSDDPGAPARVLHSPPEPTA